MEEKEYEEKMRVFVYSGPPSVRHCHRTAVRSHRTVPFSRCADTVYMARKDSGHVRDSLVERQVVNNPTAVHDAW